MAKTTQESEEGESSNRSNGSYLTIIGLLFLLSFSVPLFFGLKFLKPPTPSASESEQDSHSTNFEAPFEIGKAGDIIRISGGNGLDPLHDEDFLVIGWFRLFKLPAKGQKIFLYSKNEGIGNSSGYGLALINDDDEVLPMAYWKTQSGEGRWFAFSPISIKTREWFMLALSFQGDQMLGLHFSKQSGKEMTPVETLGGYKLDEFEELPASNADLLSGALGSNFFRGKVGLLGIISEEIGQLKLTEILSSSVADPRTVPAGVKADAVKLWVTDVPSDSSMYNHPVSYRGDSHKRKGKQQKRRSKKAKMK